MRSVIRATTQPESGPLAVIHGAGGTWRVLLASADARPAIIDSAEFPDAEADRIAPLLARHHARRAIVVLPASKVVCRSFSLPSAADAALARALELQAQTHLPSSIPAHRRATAVLPPAPGETSRTGIVLSWPPAATYATPRLAEPATKHQGGDAMPLRVSFTADIVALAALMNGQRPAAPLLWTDRASGAVALALTHAGGATFRATQEASSHEEGGKEWCRRITAAVAETALSGGHTGAFVTELGQRIEPLLATVRPGSAAIIVPDETVALASEHLTGVRTDREWWSTFGVAAGALLAANGPCAALTALADEAVVDRPPRLERVARALTNPRTALMTAVACLAIIGIAPVAMSGLRLMVLKVRHGDVAADRRAVEEIGQQLAMYDALRTDAWPMTKLLADIVCNTPESVQLETIKLTQGQPFLMTGRVLPQSSGGQRLSAPDVMRQLLQRLEASRLFAEVRYRLSDPNAYDQYEFELSAKVANAYARPAEYPIEIDYGRWTLKERISGIEPEEAASVRAETRAETATALATDEGAEAVTPPGGDPQEDALADAGSSPAAPSSTGRRPGGSEFGGDRVAGTSMGDPSTRTTTIDPTQIQPLTKEQIDAMTIDEARANQLRVAKARNSLKNSDDETLKERLRQEFEWLKERVRRGA
jgi:hypothetical protein